MMPPERRISRLQPEGNVFSFNLLLNQGWAAIILLIFFLGLPFITITPPLLVAQHRAKLQVLPCFTAYYPCCTVITFWVPPCAEIAWQCQGTANSCHTYVRDPECLNPSPFHGAWNEQTEAEQEPYSSDEKAGTSV